MATIKPEEQVMDGLTTEDEPMADDKLREIGEWLEYMQGELDKEQIDLVELSEIDRVYEIIKEQE